MNELVVAQDYLDEAEQLVMAIRLVMESNESYGGPINAITRAVDDKIDSARSALEELSDKCRAIEEEERAKEEKVKYEEIRKETRAIVRSTVMDSWQKSLSEAEAAAANGDEEAAKDAEAWRLWIDMRARQEAREAKEGQPQPADA